MAATHERTITALFPMWTAGYSSGTSYNDSSDLTIYIPQTTSRAFKSVKLIATSHDTNASPANDISSWSVRASCNGGTNWTTVTQSSTIADTGETISNRIEADVTNEFVNRFGSGASGTCRVGWYLNFSSASTINNVAISLEITYEFDATAHTSNRVKTVWIPIESNTGQLGTALAEIGTDQIPNLDTFLPESSKTYRQKAFELSCMTLPSGTTDNALCLALDSEAEATMGTIEFGPQSNLPLRTIWIRDDMATNATHKLKARHNAGSGSYYDQLGGLLHVTYEYDPASSTNIKSLRIPLPLTGFLNTSSFPSNVQVKFWVNEPGTITLKQSALVLFAPTSSTNDTLSVKVGSQSVRAYTPTSQTDTGSVMMVVHRIDTGGAQGAGMTLQAGENTVDIQMYCNSTRSLGLIYGYLIINYTSGVDAQDEANHAHTTMWQIAPSNRALSNNLQVTFNVTPSIIPANWCMIAAGIEVLCNAATPNGLMTIQLEISRETGDSPASGMQIIGDGMGSGASGEKQWLLTGAAATDFFKRYPGDPDARRLAVEVARTISSIHAFSTQLGATLYLTYSSLQYDVSGAVYGYSGDGSGITVSLHRADTGELLATATTSAGGGYTITWYEDVISKFTQARQSSSLLGRSDNGA